MGARYFGRGVVVKRDDEETPAVAQAPMSGAATGAASEAERRSAGVSASDWARRDPANDPFRNGTFTGGASVPAIARTGGGGTGAALIAQSRQATDPAINEATRRSAGISTADWARRDPTNDPFRNGFFRSAEQRAEVEQARLGTPGHTGVALARNRTAAPAIARPAAPVKVDPSSGAQGNTRQPAVRPVTPAGDRGLVVQNGTGNRLISPYGTGTTVFDGSAGTRRPFIAGADGRNVARDFLDEKDPTLNRGYVATLPPARNQRALVRGSAGTGLFARR